MFLAMTGGGDCQVEENDKNFLTLAYGKKYNEELKKWPNFYSSC